MGAVFLVGIGVFQIPAGFLAVKYGPRKIALSGLWLSSLSAGLCGLSPSFETVLVFRFLAGVFMSFFFRPGIAFFTPFFSVKERGTALGIYNAGFHAGTLVALGAWPYVLTSVGWRLGLLIPGLLGILLTVITYFITGNTSNIKDGGNIEFNVLRDGNVWLAALGLTLSGGSWYPLTQFGILYLTTEAGLQLGTAGMLIALMSVGSILGSPFTGRLYDAFSSKRRS